MITRGSTVRRRRDDHQWKTFLWRGDQVRADRAPDPLASPTVRHRPLARRSAHAPALVLARNAVPRRSGATAQEARGIAEQWQVRMNRRDGS